MILADTTVLVYAVGADHPLREPCRELVRRVRDDELRARTTVEVIQEFAHVWARRRPRPDAARVARDYSTAFGPLIRPDADDLAEGLELFGRTSTLGAFDAVLAASARRRSLVLVSADRAFHRVSGLTHLNPAARTFLRDLTRLG